jgi:hypothetical protein
MGQNHSANKSGQPDWPTGPLDQAPALHHRLSRPVPDS